MADLLAAAARTGKEKHPRTVDKPIQYGTAGFRSKASELEFVMYRMGLLAVLRSKATKATVGVMITASHNPEEDNGVKLIDPSGDMLEAVWEILATHLVNVTDDELIRTLEHIIFSTNLDTNALAMVFIAMDTRPSSSFLASAVKDGVEALGGMIQDFGLLTTPQLHYIVCCNNARGNYGEPTEEGYYKKLSSAFLKLRGNEVNQGNYLATVRLDGANGVGALKMKAILPYLGESLSVDIHNDGNGKLNYQCGADYIKIHQKPPEGFPLEAGTRCISFDGDGDRIIYFYLDNEGNFHLLDGDKIATLITGFIKELLTKSGLNINLGLVQTAYANGNATNYVQEILNVPVACVPTGVKHLHHRATQFDIGVYFEANGHGTVVFSSKTQQQISDVIKGKRSSPEQKSAAQNLLLLMDIINQLTEDYLIKVDVVKLLKTVGDAISDMLLVETILLAKQQSIEDWDAAYTDLPSRQLKVKVRDRTIFTTADAERKCVEPPGVQNAIDLLISKFENGRAFVRPSGTEDIVRIYAEAATQAAADNLAYEASIKVYELAGGIGDKPHPLS